MAWFAAHAIMYFKLKVGPQDSFTVWENIYLIDAADIDEAWEKATARARREEGDDEGSLTLDGKPVELVFAGIRTISEVSHQRDDNELGEGDELTYSEFQVSDENSIRDLLSGEEVSITFCKVESEAPDSEEMQ